MDILYTLGQIILYPNLNPITFYLCFVLFISWFYFICILDLYIYTLIQLRYPSNDPDSKSTDSVFFHLKIKTMNFPYALNFQDPYKCLKFMSNMKLTKLEPV